MFPRIKSFKNKDGSIRHYLYLVETKRISGCVRQVITANFGRLDEADKNLPGIIEKLSKFTKRLKIITLSRDMRSDWVKEYGPVIIFKRLWENLKLDISLKKYLRMRKIAFDAEGLIYTMVLNRLMEPKSEL